MLRSSLLCVLLAAFLAGPLLAQPAAAYGPSDVMACEARLLEVVPRARAATIGIQLVQGTGSGVVVSPDGWVLTAAHLFRRPGQRLQAILADGTRHPIRTYGRMASEDYALMKLEGAGPFEHVAMGRSADLKVGETVFALGHPGGVLASRPAPLRLGQLSRHGRTFLRTTCTIDRGDSGGPLFDLEGRVVGIHSRIGSDLKLNMHVPVDRFREEWKRLIGDQIWGEADFPKGAVLGISGDAGPGGTRVERVFSDLPAQAAGVAVDDFITHIDGQAIDHMGELKDAIAKRSPGDEVRLTIERGEETLQLAVRLARSPEAPVVHEEGEMPFLSAEDEEDDEDTPSPADFGLAMEMPATAVAPSVVRLVGHGRRHILGTVVAPELVVTKASELDVVDQVVTATGQRCALGKIRRFEDEDLAFVTVPGLEAPAVTLATSTRMVPGRILTHVGFGHLEVGVLSVAEREVAGHRGGYLGVRLGDAPKDAGAEVREVMTDTPASNAGLEVGDVVETIDGAFVKGRMELVEVLRLKSPGSVVALGVQRGETEVAVTITLGIRPELTPATATRRRQAASLSGPLSKRREAFPKAFEHDIPLHPRECGAPLIDAKGRVLAISIARASRYGTLALSAARVRELLTELR